MYTANTALLWHNHQLFALHEGDQPHLLYVSPEGKIETQGRIHKAGKEGKWFTAHPKVGRKGGREGGKYEEQMP
jgi:carotenoid cleavage dioxygenase-like enzyme